MFFCSSRTRHSSRCAFSLYSSKTEFSESSRAISLSYRCSWRYKRRSSPAFVSQRPALCKLLAGFSRSSPSTDRPPFPSGPKPAPLPRQGSQGEAHVYKLSSTNGITGTLRLKQSEFATHTYNLTHQKSYYPLTFYRDQQPTIVRFTNWEWAIGDEFTSGSFTSLNDINATLKYNNVTYTLKGRN